MDQADSVYSTPPTNTPIDTTRRCFCCLARGRRDLRILRPATLDRACRRRAGRTVARSVRKSRMCLSGFGWRAIPCGRDVSRHDRQSALLRLTFDHKIKCVRLVSHRTFTPTPGDPIDFEATIEKTLARVAGAVALRQVLFDPFQLASVCSGWRGSGCRSRNMRRRCRI